MKQNKTEIKFEDIKPFTGGNYYKQTRVDRKNIIIKGQKHNPYLEKNISVLEQKLTSVMREKIREENNLKSRIGMLRQYLNERDSNIMGLITNEELEEFLVKK